MLILDDFYKGNQPKTIWKCFGILKQAQISPNQGFGVLGFEWFWAKLVGFCVDFGFDLLGVWLGIQF